MTDKEMNIAADAIHNFLEENYFQKFQKNTEDRKCHAEDTLSDKKCHTKTVAITRFCDFCDITFFGSVTKESLNHAIY